MKFILGPLLFLPFDIIFMTIKPFQKINKQTFHFKKRKKGNYIFLKILKFNLGLLILYS